MAIAFLLKRGDIMREYGVPEAQMKVFERAGVLRPIRLPKYKIRLYRRCVVERFLKGEDAK